MQTINIKKIDFGEQIHTTIPGVKLYSFHLIINTWPSKSFYTCFYCFNRDFLNRTKLKDGEINKIIESDLYRVRKSSFIRVWSLYADNVYVEDVYLRVFKKDEYFDEWDTIMKMFKLKSYILRYVDVNFGRIFYWEDLSIK